jgi:hypothetical protein
MATTHHWHAPHIHFPYLHVQSPHLEWHDLEHPLRAAVAATVATLVVWLGVNLANAISEASASSFVSSAPERSVTWLSRELPREWTWERSAVTFDHMYDVHARGPSVEGMYRKPR